MAILSLAEGREDLRARLGRIVIGATKDGRPVCAADLRAVGPMMALLSEAILPNLVQTTEGNAGAGALRAVCQYRAWNELGDLAEDRAAAGGLRGE